MKKETINTLLKSVWVKILLGLVFFLCVNEWAKSWIISILITISIIVHELGHLWVMKNLGANPKGFWFIPYLGAVAISSSNEKLTNWERWQIALMGPLWSLLFVMILYFSGNYIFKEVFSYSNELNLSRTLRIQHLEIERDFLKAVFLISGINLLNLLPLPPLDGGKMLEETIFSLSNNWRKFWTWIIIAIAIGVAYLMKDDMFLVGLLLLGTILFILRHGSKIEKPTMNNVDIFLGALIHVSVIVGLAMFIVLSTDEERHIEGRIKYLNLIETFQ